MNIIIGKRSNLSEKLAFFIDDVVLISSGSISHELDAIDWLNVKETNLIFNQFQPSNRLNDLSRPVDYINNSILSTAIALEYFSKKHISLNKVIYTSSSSVYGSNEACRESDLINPLSLHSALKVTNERLVSKYCQDMNVDYTLARVFNMYGGRDKFSIVSKILRSHRDNELLTIVNNGDSIRDFIHIDDVAHVYNKLLTTNNLPIINVASGTGVSVSSLLNLLKENKIAIYTNNISLSEIPVSIADNSKLLSVLGEYDFKSVSSYILDQITP
ncbi:NAD-dependent epimerase/dehydratase family protein [Planktomarina sp.]|nr:NAD-dependent epimerase/dehydratase family protein [Planktomarina sp.]